MSRSIPNVQSRVVGPGGALTPPWYDFLRHLSTAAGGSSGLQEQIDRIRQQIAEMDGLPADASVLGINSVNVSGDLLSGQVIVSLVNDQDGMGSHYVYGTDANGQRGWLQLADAVHVGGSLVRSIDWGDYDFKGELDDEGDLPPSGNAVDDAYLVLGTLWVWDGSEWVDAGAPPGDVMLALENDEATPDPSHYYGTNDAGERGFHPLPEPSAGGGILPMVNGETPPVLMYGGNQLIYARVE